MAEAKPKEDKKGKKAGGGTVIKQCSCKSEFQDKAYGAGKRACNVKANGNANCTVCGTEVKSGS